jgi:hypothetical protein
MIIDNDTCENIVSAEVVKKLQFKVEKHLTLYKLKWLNEDSKVIINKCYLFFFLGKKYFDNV